MMEMTVPLIFSGDPHRSTDTGLAVPRTRLKFKREEEADADYFGVQYLYKAGYDPEYFMHAVQTIWSLPRYSEMPASFSWFPPLSSRLAALRSEIDEITLKRNGALINTPEFAAFRKHLLNLPAPKLPKTSEPELIHLDTDRRN